MVTTINKFRELIDALPAGVITVGSFFHPHLCGSPKLPFILPVREILKSKWINNKVYFYTILFYNLLLQAISLYHKLYLVF